LVFGKLNSDRYFFDFLSKQITFVEEENDTSVNEPLRIDNLTKEFERLVHTTSLIVFEEFEIVFTQSHTEENGSDVCKARYPLLTFTALTPDIDKSTTTKTTRTTTTSAEEV
jgi:hypothetical protein